MSPRRRRLVLGVAGVGVLALGVVLLSSLRNGGHRGQEQASDGHPGRPTIGLGRVGTLPAAPPTLAAAAKLTAPEGIIEVSGPHSPGSVITFQVPIRNDGSETLAIDKVDPKRICTQAAARSRRLAPGDQTLIDVRFDTAVDGPGVHGEVIQIDSNDPASRTRPPLHGEITLRITTAEDG